MSISDNKELIQRYFEAINGKPKPDSVLNLFIAEQPLKDHAAAAEEAFPLYRIDVEEIVAEGDLVAVRGLLKGTNKGNFMGNPPTGKSFEASIYITYRVAGGKIVDHWMLMDNMALMQQLGLIPVAG